MTPEEATAAPAEEEVPSQDTPQDEAASPEETPVQDPQHDWETRYNDLRPQFDRTNQEVAQYRQIIEAARQGDPQALDWLGLEAADANKQDEEFEDPDEAMQKRLEALETQLAERDQQTEAQQFEQAEDEWLQEQVASLEAKENTQLSDEEFGLVLTNALANRLEDGQPNIDGAFKALRQAQNAYRENYVASKKATQVPAGAAGEEKFDLSNDEGRAKAMAHYMELESSDE